MLASLILTLLTNAQVTDTTGADLFPPNVLVIVMDDVGNEFVNVYGEGPAANQPAMPNIDALAANGLVFRNFYGNPVCTPTRATILTGRYAWRYSLTDAIDAGETAFLPQAEITLPEILDGYYSIQNGKWHLGNHWQNFDPIVHGFDFYAGTIGAINNYYDWTLAIATTGGQTNVQETTYSADILTDNAITLINGAPEPWFTTMAFHNAHVPFQNPPGTTSNTKLGRYKNMITYMDTKIGELLSSIDLTNTYIILLGDNGSHKDVVSTTGHKWEVLEGGVNIPLIIAGPGITTGFTNALANATDIYATIAELAGKNSNAVDSHSMVPLFTNPSATIREWAYSEINNEDHDSRMARDVKYKLIDIDGVETFVDLSVAPPGEDGSPLDIGNLTQEQQASYNNLKVVLHMRGS